MNTRILLSLLIGGLLLAVTTQETLTGVGHNNHHHLKDDSKDEFKDDIFIDDAQALSLVEGSAPVSDLDEEASGLGPDDEDTLEGSGTGEGSGAQPRILTEPEPVPPITPAPPFKAEPTQKIEAPSTTKIITTTTSKPETEATISTPHEVSTHRSKTTEHPVLPVRTSSPDVHIIGRTPEERQSPSFFSQPGILAAIIGGAVVGLLCAILLVMFIVYRMRKKDEGSYVLEEPRRSPRNTSYHPANKDSKEFFA